MANPNKPVLAAFDFDGTLTDKDSLLPFLKSTAGSLQTLKNLILEIPIFIAFCIKKASRQDVKEALLTRFLKGKPKSEIDLYASVYAHKILPNFIKPEGLKRIKWHKEQGHRCLLVSANIEAYLSIWAKNEGFDDTIASQLEFDSKNLFTGKLKGINCRGPEKIKRLESIVGPLSDFTVYAYGDSEGDRELLNAADHPFYRKFS